MSIHRATVLATAFGLLACRGTENADDVKSSTLPKTSTSDAATAAPKDGAAATGGAAKLAYPAAHRGDQVDDYHGTKVADPYRWLEQLDSPETKKWIGDENALTESWFSKLPARETLRHRITELFSYERRAVVDHVAGVTFFVRNSGLDPQNVYFKQAPTDPHPVVLIDPNQLSRDGTVAVNGFSVSSDAKYLAYGTSDGGSDWVTWHVREVATGKDLDDTIVHSKFSGAAWTKDGSGFYYCRYPEPKAGEELSAANHDHKVYFHKLGTAQSQDTLVYERPDEPDWLFQPSVTDDGQWLVVDVSPGSAHKNRILVKDLTKADAPFVKVIDNFDAAYNLLGNRGTTFYFETNLDAPKGRVVAIDLGALDQANWKEIVPTGADALTHAAILNWQLVLTYLHDASTRVQLRGLDGKLDRELALPGIGTASGFGGRNDDKDTYYTFLSFTSPPTVYHYDFASHDSTPWFAPKIAFDFSPYETRLVFATSKDGTRVPMHVTCRKDVKLDGGNPCLLYGYGGFNIPMTPTFSSARLVWLEHGGVYAQAVLRGGGEYGEKWHEAGTLGNKQNVFDDFIACAEHLIATGWTSTPKLAIQGGSNGGLLVAACLTQRPDLYGAAVPQVGVLDMLRFDLFTIGKAWRSDYGTATDAAQFPFLYKYSPLHHVKAGTKYPPTLVLTGDHDDRVFPAHSFKFAATLQAAQAGDAPTLIRVETRAGHGAGKSTQLTIEEQADVYTFLTNALGVAVM